MIDATTYTSLITSEHNQRPNFLATVAALVQPMVDLQNLYEVSTGELFDLDQAVGQQLDFVGAWIGQARTIPIPLPNTFFSWGIAGLGWGQGAWFGPGNSSTGLSILPDDQYRTLLRAVIAQNNWDGTVPGIYAIWAIVFALNGFQLLVQDNQNMTMTVLILALNVDIITLALLTNGFLVPRPAAVGITGYTQIQAPIFAWGEQNQTLGGWGNGSWI